MKNTKLWRLSQRGYDPQTFLRERLRLQNMHVGTRKSPQAKRIAGEEMTTEQRAAMASALERRDAPKVKLAYLRFLDPAQQKVKT